MRLFFLLLFCFLFLSCAKQPTNQESLPIIASESLNNSRDGVVIFWNGKNEMLRGIAIGNNVWNANEVNFAVNEPSDYERLRNLGFNAVRFYLSYKFFENDNMPYSYKQRGWDFLNQNIEWARKNGIKLILNMHVPQGGFQSNAEGAELWDDEKNQKRLLALWREIANRYANDTAIAAYDILNEPMVSKEKSQWQTLAQKIVNAIREVDANHFILIERMNGKIPSDYSNDSEMNFVFVEDPANKWGLTFHFYSPIEYTHQYASWADFFRNTDGGIYPDPKTLQFSREQWIGTTFDNPKVPSGNSDWNFYEGVWKTITDTSIANIGRPTLQCQEAGEGTVWFDSLIFEKKSPDNIVSKIGEYKFPFVKEGWYFWAEKNGGRSIEGKDGVGITGTISDANYATSRMFTALEPSYSYRVSGKMKGENVPAAAFCRIRFDWNYANNLSRRDKAFLERDVNSYLKIAQERNLPVYLGEFGVIEAALTNEKGGLIWVRDMLDILKSHNISFSYHAWYDGSFGVKDRPELEAAFKNKFLMRR